jgi:hypothetical protein
MGSGTEKFDNEFSLVGCQSFGDDSTSMFVVVEGIPFKGKAGQ